LAVSHTDSDGETIQRLLPEAKVVKAFNIVGNPHMVHLEFEWYPPTMFIYGNNEQAKKIVTDNFLTPFG
jgi:8-hydroxy-5-deazaflavin:NADPH oxidoreductase